MVKYHSGGIAPESVKPNLISHEFNLVIRIIASNKNQSFQCRWLYHGQSSSQSFPFQFTAGKLSDADKII